MAVISLLISCKEIDPNKQIDEGTIRNQLYFSEEIGWTIEIPENWKVISREQSEAYQEIGLDAMEETVDVEIDVTGLKNLIGFQKNRFNLFQSTSEPYKETYEGEWVEDNATLKKVIYQTYVDQGIKVDSTITKVISIDSLDFHYYELTIYGPDGKELLNQLMISRLINGFDFGVNINYNNQTDKGVMLNAWRNSKFKK